MQIKEGQVFRDGVKELTYWKHRQRGFIGFFAVGLFIAGSAFLSTIVMGFLFLLIMAVSGDTNQVENDMALAIIACTALLSPYVLSTNWAKFDDQVRSFPEASSQAAVQEKRSLLEKPLSQMNFLELLEMQKWLIAKLIVVNEQIEKEERNHMELAKQKSGKSHIPTMEPIWPRLANSTRHFGTPLAVLLTSGKL